MAHQLYSRFRLCLRRRAVRSSSSSATSRRLYHAPPELNFTAFKIFGTQFPFYRVLIAFVSCAIFAFIYLLLTKTRVGIVVRAAERLPVMTSALGHDVGLVFSGVFTAGAAIAGLAGAIGGAYYPTSPSMALDVG